jgi:hypothetical protein
VKKRNLLLLAIVYWLAALVAIGLAVVTAGDCGIAAPSGRAACTHGANVRETWGFVIAIIGFPITLAWYAMRCRSRN